MARLLPAPLPCRRNLGRTAFVSRTTQPFGLNRRMTTRSRTGLDKTTLTGGGRDSKRKSIREQTRTGDAEEQDHRGGKDMGARNHRQSDGFIWILYGNFMKFLMIMRRVQACSTTLSIPYEMSEHRPCAGSRVGEQRLLRPAGREAHATSTRTTGSACRARDCERPPSAPADTRR